MPLSPVSEVSMRQATQGTKGKKLKGKSVPEKESISTDLVTADDSSVVSAVSAESFAFSGNGSVQAGSHAGSVASKARDSDSEMSILQNKYGAGAMEKFKLETCTVIVFISIDGILSEYPQTKRITSYSELQREIARIQPKTKKMFVVQDINGVPLSSRNFKGYDLIRVKEICIKPRFEQLKKLSIDWEDAGYHEAVYKRPAAADDNDSVSYLSQETDDEDYRL